MSDSIMKMSVIEISRSSYFLYFLRHNIATHFINPFIHPIYEDLVFHELVTVRIRLLLKFQIAMVIQLSTIIIEVLN